MARNRKTQSSAIRFGAALKAGLICMVIVVCGVGYVWQKQQINILADQIRNRETHVKLLHDQNDKLRRQLAALMSPEQLDQRVKDLKLGLGPPQQPNQVWWLPEPAAETAATADQPHHTTGQSRELASATK